jgi:hypothetical protein
MKAARMISRACITIWQTDPASIAGAAAALPKPTGKTTTIG